MLYIFDTSLYVYKYLVYHLLSDALSLSEQSSHYASQHIVVDIHHLRDHKLLLKTNLQRF
jgi:hypothetical protein